jgi:hypothetical protein
MIFSDLNWRVSNYCKSEGIIVLLHFDGQLYPYFWENWILSGSFEPEKIQILKSHWQTNSNYSTRKVYE